MKRKPIFTLMALVAGLGIALPLHEAQAVFHPTSGDILGMALDALDFVDNVLLGVVTRIFVALLTSSALLLSSARFLDWAVGIPIDLQNNLVKAGFEFTSGLVNLVIVVLVVLVAFSAILKFDAFGAKKALPKLILVALLVNFSMLIVGFFVDIAQVLFNSIETTVGKNLADSAIETMTKGLGETISWFGTFYTAWLAKSVIPFAQVPGTIFIGNQIINGLSGGQLLQAIFLIAINTIVGAVFALYALLFVARVVVIWLLAIVAPLALAAWAFPAKNNYFGDWFKQLVSWSFLGIVAFFLMGIGMRLFAMILTLHPVTGTLALPQGIGEPLLHPAFYAYIFLAVYLFIAFQVSKKFAPTAATALIEQGKALVMPQLKAIGSRVGAAAWKRLGQKPAEKIGERIKTYGEGLRTKGGWLGKTAGGGIQRLGKRVEVGAGTLSRGVTSQANQEATAAENEQYTHAAGNRDKINEELQKGSAANWNRIIGLTNSMIKHGDSDDLTEYIMKGELDGKAIGKALLFGHERLGPAGYRTMIKGLGGMIYTDPEKLGWGVQQAAEITDEQQRMGYEVKDGVVVDSYGSKAIKGKDKDQTNFLENTVKREIVEKVQPGDITQQDIFGNYMKRFHDYAPDSEHPEMSAHWRAGGEALTKRLLKEAGGKFVAALSQKQGSGQGRREWSAFMQDYTDTHFGQDDTRKNPLSSLSDDDLNSMISIIKVLSGPGARNLGLTVGYRGEKPADTTVAIAQETQKRAEVRAGQPEQDLTNLQTQLQAAQNELARLYPGTGTIVVTPGTIARTEKLDQQIKQLNQDIARVRPRAEAATARREQAEATAQAHQARRTQLGTLIRAGEISLAARRRVLDTRRQRIAAARRVPRSVRESIPTLEQEIREQETSLTAAREELERLERTLAAPPPQAATPAQAAATTPAQVQARITQLQAANVAMRAEIDQRLQRIKNIAAAAADANVPRGEARRMQAQVPAIEQEIEDFRRKIMGAREQIEGLEGTPGTPSP